ncbi:MAG: alpha/beta fold hydrolase, partial [Anaerolineales bacterium]|nr:alpha/beta fold hydrolase [Anaerolineales bacterium]
MPANRRQRLRRAFALALAVAGGLVAAVMPLAWADGTQAAALPRPTSTLASAGSVEAIGLASLALDCLVAGSKAERAAGDVALAWTGQAERARLILRAAGNQVAQPVRVNGRLVGYVPEAVSSDLCWGEPVYLDVPVRVLAQGQNRIEISAEALPGDEWTAAQMRLEVIGRIGRPATEGSLAEGGGPLSLTVPFENAYDDTPQQAWLQVPSGYQTSVPVPVVVYVHGRSSYMYEPAEPGNQFAAEAEARGWLLVSPEMHGRWPGTGAVPTPDAPGKYAYASLESQYDVIGALRYVLEHYNVQRDRLYLIGPSMGGQIGTIVVAKYPDVFAAAAVIKAPSDMAQWYGQSTTFHQDWMERECYTGSSANPTPQPPSGNQLCYARRSGQMFASNYLHVPITLSHSLIDALVPVTHSFQLRDRINSFGPDQPATVYVDTLIGPTCPYTPPSPPGYHCFEPDADDVFDFFQQHTLDNAQLDL